MPFDLATVNGVHCFAFRGVFVIRDLLNAVEEAGRIEQAAEVSPDRLIDLSAVESIELNFADMKCAADIRRAAPLRNKVKSAIVAPTPEKFGFARMFQTIMDNPRITVNIFKDRESAWVWLGADKEQKL